MIAIYVSAIDSALITIVPWAGIAALTTLLIKNYSLHKRSPIKTMMDREETEAEETEEKGSRTKEEEAV